MVRHFMAVLYSPASADDGWGLLVQDVSDIHPARGPIARHGIAATIETLGKLQVDAISVLERTHFLVLFSRLGAFDRRV
jgi:uncharacterized protein YcaQ